MINKILPLLNNLIPAGLAVKGLGKMDPRLSKFISSAAAAGYGTDMALNYLRSKFEAPGEKTEKERLESGAARGTLRPDEMAARQQISQSENIPNLLQKGVALGAGALAGGLPGLAAEGASQLAGNQQSSDLGKAEHVPGLGQLKAEHVPRGPREEAMRSMNAKRKGVAGQMEQEFDQQYGNQEVDTDAALLAALDKILKM